MARCQTRLAFWAGFVAAALRLGAADELAEGFAAPPADTRPWCYWYWISDNLSKEGITRDLEAMARVGIGEALIGNVVDPDTPLGSVKLLSPEWEACMTHAAVEGRRVGVNIGVFNSPGWSQSGGPWVAPTQAMRYVAYSEVRVKGPSTFVARLPAPAEAFQDIATLAFPAPKADAEAPRPQAVRCAPELADADRLCDGSAETGCALPGGVLKAGQSLTLDLAYAAPVTARSLSVTTLSGSFSARGELLAADGAGGYRPVREFVLDRRGLGRPAYAVNVGFQIRGPTVVSFPAVTAQAFRLKLTLLAVEGVIAGSVTNAAVAAPGLAEVALAGAARLDGVTEKQLGKMHPTPLPDWGSYLWPAPAEPESSDFAVDPARIVNLSDRLSADGALRWQVPAGEWVILRCGMTPTGAHNHPTTDEGRGPEVDKMSRAAVEAHFDGFVGPYLKRLPADARAAVTRVVIDSYEVGSQNWTDDFHASFEKAFGYDPRLWLPVLTGRLVGSADRSERFLWDLRRHVADRIATEYVGGLRGAANRSGLRLWLENYGHWGFPSEFLRYGGESDDLGGEYWIRDCPPAAQGAVELRAASSAAHLYGKRRVFSEAFTSARSFLEAPGNIKTLGDWSFCQGVNHLVLHVYIHQPWDDRKPGVNAWFGTEFNRHNTWFEPSKAWVDYLRRCHYLLQRGASVADVAYFIGEDAPKMIGVRSPALPAGYDYDYINADGLLKRARVVNGRLAIPDGPSYAVLALPPQRTLTPAVARRLRDLVAEGACVLGEPPARSPSLAGYPAGDAEVAALAAEVWGGPGDGAVTGLVSRAFGKGRVCRGDDLARALREAGAAPALLAPEGVLWTQRRDGDTDIFFISNQKGEPVLADLSFRAAGKAPELWHPDSGRIEESAWFETAAGRTRVPVSLAAQESLFVVFRKPAAGASVARVLKDGQPATARVVRDARRGVTVEADAPGRYTLERTDGTKSSLTVALPAPAPVAGPWQVRFPLAGGAELRTNLTALASWSASADPAVRHFAGTATYATTFAVDAAGLKPGRRVWLDLGAVEVMAEVSVNGRPLGTLWKRPYAVDVTEAARVGSNDLEVRVTSLWWNRLVGDDKLEPGARSTFTTARPRSPRNRLLPAGLLGPVAVRVTAAQGEQDFFPFCIDWHDAKKRGFAEQAAMLKELGYGGVGHIWLDKVEERLATLDAAGLKLVQITMQVSLAPDKPPYDQARFKQVLEAVKGRGVQFLLIMNGAKASDYTQDGRAVEIVREMAELAKPGGSELLLYPHTNDWIERIEDAVRVAKQVDRPNVGVMFNLCHWLRVCPDRDYRTRLAEAMPYLRAVSLNGADERDERAGKPNWERYIQPLGSGSFDVGALVRALDELGYAGPVGLQCFGLGGDAAEHLARSLAAWRALRRDAGQSAP